MTVSCLKCTQGVASSRAAGDVVAGKTSRRTKAAMAELFGSDSDDEEEAAGTQQTAAHGTALSASEAVAAAKKGFWTGQPASNGGKPQAAGKAAGKLAVAPRLAAEAGVRRVDVHRADAAPASSGMANVHPAEAGSSRPCEPARPAKPVRSLSAALRQSSVPEAVKAKLAAQVGGIAFPTLWRCV